MATLTVGVGQQYSTIASAVAASRDGDVLQVQAGTYVNDFAEINTRITLQGVGGMVKMVATGNIPNDKGILITNTDVIIDHFEFSGAKGPSGNDAGIRYQSGNLIVTNSYFHDNQNGILGNPSATGTILIDNSEFARNGAGDGYTHNLYIGVIAKLTITDSYFHDAIVGNEIKSRALETIISNTRVYDNSSTASWSIDLPNGGKATLTNNVIQQGPNSENFNIISFGVEGAVSGSQLTMSNNVVVNDLGRGALIVTADGAQAAVTGTQIFGPTTLTGTGISISNTTQLTSRPTLDTAQPFEGGTTTPVTPPAPAPPSTPGSNLIGGAGNDTLQGTSGADTIDGGAGSNYLRGNDDHDLIRGGAGFDDINGNKGNDTAYGGLGNDWVVGGQNEDLLYGEDGNDIVYGNIGNDTLYGGSGTDTMRGGQNEDVLFGDAGNDWLTGDRGNDTITGGAGGDTFYTWSEAGDDRVTDFSYAEGDRVQVDIGAGYALVDTGPDVMIVLSSTATLTLVGVAMSSLGVGWIFNA